MALNRPRWKRWRYVMVISIVGTLLAALVTGLLLGRGLGWSLGVGVFLAGTTAALDLVQWRVHGARLRQQGWEW
ncbi:MAG: hypothetical protein M3Q65_24720 [Chloroflexota bacterium]|nr:hypothetical protein [Chloroflexota bacterium]